jgi:hypothetical protein
MNWDSHRVPQIKLQPCSQIPLAQRGAKYLVLRLCEENPVTNFEIATLAQASDPSLEIAYVGMLRSLGFHSLSAGFCIDPQLTDPERFGLIPMRRAEQLIWRAFLHECYEKERFSTYDVTKIPMCILELLQEIERLCLFVDYEILVNESNQESMLVATRDQEKFFRLGRWCPEGRTLMSISSVKATLQHQIREGKEQFVRRWGPKYRLTILGACNAHACGCNLDWIA